MNTVKPDDDLTWLSRYYQNKPEPMNTFTWVHQNGIQYLISTIPIFSEMQKGVLMGFGTYGEVKPPQIIAYYAYRVG